MKFLLDENFPVSMVEAIVSAGHEAIRFDEACQSGDDDETVFSIAQRLDAVILTSDRDFYHTVPLLHPTHSGIIVVALHQPNRKAIRDRVEWFLNNFDEPLSNRVFILRDNSCRAR
jgi:Uncharacterized protein conserved in bacteria